MLDHQKNIPSLSAVAMPERATSQKARESWHVLGIISEFIEAAERLSEVRPAVSIFGSARTRPGAPMYDLTVEIARKLSDAGFAVISGGGPGIMEAANRGAFEGSSPSVGLNIELPFEQHGNPYQDISLRFSSLAVISGGSQGSKSANEKPACVCASRESPGVAQSSAGRLPPNPRWG